MGIKEWWERRPYWQKCGIIGIIVGEMLVFLAGPIDFLRVFTFLLYLLPGVFVKYVLNCQDVSCMGIVLLVSTVIVPLELFLIGALISFVIQKVRKK